ncbi:MAG: hypothetical protein H6Q14_2632 [Bacteroidetes bacterium]|jgi:hypothetical protein|nr:hypothetical protein [Bacteroidota bacterium]
MIKLIIFYKFIKMNVLSFFSSKNRKFYWKLSIKYRTTPWFVYNLAHGKPTKNPKGRKILKELLEKGIIKDINLA